MSDILEWKGNKDLVKSLIIENKWVFGIGSCKCEKVTEFKKLSELDQSILVKYNNINSIYKYEPSEFAGDELHIVEYDILGATFRKRDEQLYIVAERLGKITGKHLLSVSKDNKKVVDCGKLMSEEVWISTDVNNEYLGYRRSKWIKKDISDVLHLGGIIYER